MFEIKEKPKMVERALLISAYIQAGDKPEAASLLEELEELVNTLGIPIVDRLLISHRENHANLLLGSGKAESIAGIVKEKQIDVIVFDLSLIHI